MEDCCEDTPEPVTYVWPRNRTMLLEFRTGRLIRQTLKMPVAQYVHITMCMFTAVAQQECITNKAKEHLMYPCIY